MTAEINQFWILDKGVRIRAQADPENTGRGVWGDLEQCSALSRCLAVALWIADLALSRCGFRVGVVALDLQSWRCRAVGCRELVLGLQAHSGGGLLSWHCCAVAAELALLRWVCHATARQHRALSGGGTP